MSFNKELAVSHIGAAEQSLAYLQLEINNPSYNEHNALWHIKRARLCIDKVERILSDKQPSSEPEPPLQQASCSTLRELLEQKLNRVNAVLRSETAINFDKVRAECHSKYISLVMSFIDEL